jgi:hypothetical protein
MGAGRDESGDDRARRLAVALRENLRRRKAQGRARAATAPDDAGAPPQDGLDGAAPGAQGGRDDRDPD